MGKLSSSMRGTGRSIKFPSTSGQIKLVTPPGLASRILGHSWARWGEVFVLYGSLRKFIKVPITSGQIKSVTRSGLASRILVHSWAFNRLRLIPLTVALRSVLLSFVSSTATVDNSGDAALADENTVSSP